MRILSYGFNKKKSFNLKFELNKSTLRKRYYRGARENEHILRYVFNEENPCVWAKESRALDRLKLDNVSTHNSARYSIRLESVRKR